jgi:predicted ferric reductase
MSEDDDGSSSNKSYCVDEAAPLLNRLFAKAAGGIFFSTATATLCRVACRITCLIVLGWCTAYILLGSSPRGRAFFSSLAEEALSDAKAGSPTIALTIPLLLAACFSTLFFLPSRASSHTAVVRSARGLNGPFLNALSRWFTLGQSGGDLDFNRIALIFLALPALCSLSFATYRRMLKADTNEAQIKAIGNSLASAAVVTLSFWMIPVTKHSIMLTVLGWSPIHATKLHVWAGRMSTFGFVMHGVCHFWRWTLLQENLWTLIVPPASCWKWFVEEAEEMSCQSPQTQCNCTAFFRNLTGVLASTALLVLTMSSLSWVRRKHYRIFYICHMSMAPMFLIMAVVHWSRTIFYLLPSVLYYAAATCPSVVQRVATVSRGGSKLIKVTPIPGCDNKLIELWFEALPASAAVLSHAPAQYARVCVPSIATIWHPFTVFTSPEDMKTVRMMFRATGPWTKSLAQQILQTSTSLPTIVVDGFYGGPDRISQALGHDAVVMIAGGIGITPYLSFLPMLCTSLKGLELPRTRKVTLHWICREEGLIQYVTRHYFAHVIDQATRFTNARLEIKIVIHHTGVTSSTAQFSDENEDVEQPGIDSGNEHIMNQKGVGVIPSLHASGSSTAIFGNVPAFIVMVIMTWTSLIAAWMTNHRLVHKDQIWSRVIPLTAVLVISFSVALVAHFVFQGRCQTSPVVTKSNNVGGVGPVPSVCGEEMEEFMKSAVTLSSSLDGEIGSSNCGALIHESGRPCIESIIEDATSSAESPGIFICAPKPIMEAGRRISSQTKCSMCNNTAGIALYEEAFSP